MLANRKDLNLRITILPRTYDAYWGTENATGVKYRKKISIKVVNEINEG
ncbi:MULTISPECIES: hypothetical protein [Sphingobacterium]|nr:MULTISPECIES: hypothetical protein [unclassified Sphingobacterium]